MKPEVEYPDDIEVGAQLCDPDFWPDVSQPVLIPLEYIPTGEDEDRDSEPLET